MVVVDMVVALSFGDESKGEVRYDALFLSLFVQPPSKMAPKKSNKKNNKDKDDDAHW